MQQMNDDDPIQTDIEVIEENDKSMELELEKTPTSTRRETSSSMSMSSPSVKRKSSNSPSKSKRFCKFNKEWMKLSTYASFLQECRTDSSLAHCSICKSNFSIANGGKYLIDRHLEQAIHKRLAAAEAKQKSNSLYRLVLKMQIKLVFCPLARSLLDFIPHSTELTKLVAAEITLVYHGIRHGHSYLSQGCTVDVSKRLFHDSTIGKNLTCGRTKAREIAVNVLGEQTFFLIQ